MRPLRFRLRTLMIAVAILAVLLNWVILNGFLLDEIVVKDLRPPAPAEVIRVFIFTVLAWIAGPLAGAAVAYVLWINTVPLGWDLGNRTLLRGARDGGIAGAIGGFVGWSLATLLLCIGYSADGQTPLAAVLLGLYGGGIHVIPGLIVGVFMAKVRLGDSTNASASG